MSAPHVAVDGSATRSKRPAAYPTGVGGYAVSADGPYLITSDGRRLLDWACALGATPIGAAHPAVVQAVTRQVADGGLFSFPHVIEEETAARLCGLIPWAEQIKFVKTGSEACAGAIRIARTVTGRDLIGVLRGHYHGWHDWHAVTATDHPGIPDVLQSQIRVMDPDALDCTGLAAIILEPVTRDWVPGTREQIVTLVSEAHRCDALVIFDEMVTGGRIAIGGGSEHFEITPDLAVYGKAFGGGLPLAFIAGPKRLMEHSAYISGTYSGDALALAACQAMLDVYQREPILDGIWAAGYDLQEVFREYQGIAVAGLPPLWSFRFHTDHERRMSIFVQVAAVHDVLFHPTYVMPPGRLEWPQIRRTMDVVRIALDAALGAGELTGETYAASIRS